VLRWVLISQFPETIAVMIFAQLLHAASFGIYHGCAIQLIHRYFSGRHQGRGQALYSSLSFGAGGAAGSYISGVSWETIGASNVYLLAAVFALIAFVIAWVWIRPTASEEHNIQ
jgi:PPP family 3-phenylpropionic acid transporter